MRVAYFGRRGSYAHLAATQRFGRSATYLSCPTHAQVIDALLSRKSTAGVLPLENSVAGVVMDTIDVLVTPEFVRSDLRIREYLEQAPNLALLSNLPMKRIHRLYSHPYPLRYLAHWIQKHLPQVELFETVSTSEAAQLASEQLGSAAIAGPHAAGIYGLRVIRSRLARAREYITRFCIVASKPTTRRRPTHASLCFGLKHRPGALVKALSILAAYRLNLTRILSRPLSQRTGKFNPHAYLFWVDVNLHTDPHVFVNALKELKTVTTFLDVVGEHSISPASRSAG